MSDCRHMLIMCVMKHTPMPLFKSVLGNRVGRLLPLCASALLLSACAVTELPPYNPDAVSSPAPAPRPAPVQPVSGAVSQPIPQSLTPEQAQQLQPSNPATDGSDSPSPSANVQPNLPMPVPPTTQICDAGPAQFAVGQPYSPALLAQVRERTQARGVRLLRPGDAASIGGNPQRANLVLDADNKVTSVECG